MTIATAWTAGPGNRIATLTDEGFRLFFPLAALQLALWPLLWVFVHRFDLPFSSAASPSIWHAQEMLVGGFGASLIGFITTAAPEWTDTSPPRGRPLLILAGLWFLPRVIGLVGADPLLPLAAVLDAAWLMLLIGFLLRLSFQRGTTRLLPFAGWIAALLCAALWLRWAMWQGEALAAQALVRIVALIFAGLVGLALSRINVPITNLVLDPSERTSPFRPHPGRFNLAPGLIAIAIGGEGLGMAGMASPTVTGFLWIAAGAAFMDRVAEAFIGREILTAEILALAGTSILAGFGLLLVGLARLGAVLPESGALHLLMMGGVGLGVLAVFAIAGRLHTGRPLGLSAPVKIALALVALSSLLRAVGDISLVRFPGPPHGVAAALWSAAFLIWLWAELPYLADPRTRGTDRC